MLFRTELTPNKSNFKISHESKILSVGSCFADCMGSRFDDLQFDIVSNPFGVLYNPLSIFENLENSITGKKLDENQIVESRGLFFHYQLHSDFFGETLEELSEKIKTIQESTRQNIREANFLFITLGTAFVYFLKEGNASVANCHKMSATLFDKRMITVEEIVRSFKKFLTATLAQNPTVKVVITVSPVRHIKDTLELNSVSKSVLRLACHQIAQEYSENVSYFPAYEILMDDLRDYRFYKEDLIHPNYQAEQYVWEKFAETYFSGETVTINSEITDIQASLAHRPFHPTSEDYRFFLEKTAARIHKLNNKIAVPRLLEKMALKLKT